MKKILIYNCSLARGGAERVTVYLADYMVKHGVECEILTEKIWKKEYEIPEGVVRTCLTKKNYFSKVRELRRIIKESKADALLVMGVPNCIYAIPASWGLKMKVVVSERNDPTHFSGKVAVKYLSRFLMKQADGFVFQTAEAKAYYAKGLKNRGCVIFNPLITEKLPDIYREKRTKNIVSAGRLAPQKNQKMLIEAFAELSKYHPEYALTIYGDGPLRGALEAQVKSLGLEGKVELPGNVNDLLERIKDAAIFVMSSDFEGMPNALIEAMAIGLPSISTDCPCGGPRELIENRGNGILVSVGNSAELAEALRELVENPKLAAEIGKNAADIRDRLDGNVIGRQWLDYLSNV